MTFTNGRAQISAQMGLDAAGPVSLAQFQRVREGMSRDEVTAIMGSPGTYAGFTDLGGRYSEGYRWRGRNAGATASVSFVDGRASHLFQIGLN